MAAEISEIVNQIVTVNVSHHGTSGPANNEIFAMELACNKIQSDIIAMINLTSFSALEEAGCEKSGSMKGEVSEHSGSGEISGASKSSIRRVVKWQNNNRHLVLAQPLNATCHTSSSQNWKGERSFQLSASVQVRVQIHRLPPL